MQKFNTWRFIVYEDKLEETKALCGCFAKEWFYIKHNRDWYNEEVKDEEGNIIHCKGEIKKEHYHFTIVKSYNTDMEMIKKQFNQQIVLPISFEESLRYVLHETQKDKAQYELSEVNYTGTKDLKAYLERPTDESEAFLKLMELLEYAEINNFTYKQLLKEVGKRGLWRYYRQGYMAISPILRESGIIRS